MLKDYKSKTTIKAFQVTESLFDDYRNASQAQKLPTNEIHFNVEEKFCTLNCDNNTLVYQGIVLNVGDYLIKSGNSLDPCPKDKFEEDFGIVEVLCGECNCDKETEGDSDKIVLSAEEFKSLEEIQLLNESNIIKIQQLRDIFVADTSEITSIDYSELPQDNLEAIAYCLDLLVNNIKENKCEPESKETIGTPETEEEQKLRMSEQITYLMGILNIESINRKEEDGVMVNDITYFAQENNN